MRLTRMETAKVVGLLNETNEILSDMGWVKQKEPVRMKRKKQKKVLIAYLKLCLENEDWHGVSDAANDIRERIVGRKNKNKKRK